MHNHTRDGFPTRASISANWRTLKAWVKRDLLKGALKGFLQAIGILPRRPQPPFPYTWARDRFGRWELRVPASSLNEPSPDKW